MQPCYLAIIYDTQILTFLKADRNIINKDGSKLPALAIYPSQFQKHLRSLMINISTHDLVGIITNNLYPGMSRTG